MNLHIMLSFIDLWELFFNWLWGIIYSIMLTDSKPTQQKKVEQYEYKYWNAFDNLKEKSSNIKTNFINNCVMDYTPYGNVIMEYNKDEEMFMYYCDKREIPFKYLETVARKFVINNKCFSIYVDIRDELRPKKMDVEVVEIKEDEKEDGVKNDKMKNVFATFKKKNGKAGVKQETKKKVIFKECLNKYKWCGRLKDYSIFESSHLDYARSKKPHAEVEELSFADFKNKNKTD